MRFRSFLSPVFLLPLLCAGVAVAALVVDGSLGDGRSRGVHGEHDENSGGLDGTGDRPATEDPNHGRSPLTSEPDLAARLRAASEVLETALRDRPEKWEQDKEWQRRVLKDSGGLEVLVPWLFKNAAARDELTWQLADTLFRRHRPYRQASEDDYRRIRESVVETWLDEGSEDDPDRWSVGVRVMTLLGTQSLSKAVADRIWEHSKRVLDKNPDWRIRILTGAIILSIEEDSAFIMLHDAVDRQLDHHGKRSGEFADALQSWHPGGRIGDLYVLHADQISIDYVERMELTNDPRWVATALRVRAHKGPGQVGPVLEGLQTVRLNGGDASLVLADLIRGQGQTALPGVAPWLRRGDLFRRPFESILGPGLKDLSLSEIADEIEADRVVWSDERPALVRP